MFESESEEEDIEEEQGVVCNAILPETSSNCCLTVLLIIHILSHILGQPRITCFYLLTN